VQPELGGKSHPRLNITAKNQHPNPQLPQGGLWEASKEKAKDAYNYTTQTAHNLGAKIGIVNPTPAEKADWTAHQAGVNMGLEEPTTGEKIQNTAHRAAVNTGLADPTPSDRMNDALYRDTEPTYRAPPPQYGSTGFTDPVYEKMKDTAHSLGVKIGLVNPTPEEKAAEAAHTFGVKTGLEEPTMGERVKGTMENVGEKTREKAHEAGVKMGVVEPTVGEKIKGTMENAGERAKDKAWETKEAAKFKAQQYAKGVEPGYQPTITKNPIE